MIVAETIKKEGNKQSISFILSNRSKSKFSFRAKVRCNKDNIARRMQSLFLQTTCKLEQMNINPYADERGMPLVGHESDYFDWEKRKAEKKFSALPIEKQIELRKTSERFAPKMNS